MVEYNELDSAERTRRESFAAEKRMLEWLRRTSRNFSLIGLAIFLLSFLFTFLAEGKDSTPGCEAAQNICISHAQMNALAMTGSVLFVFGFCVCSVALCSWLVATHRLNKPNAEECRISAVSECGLLKSPAARLVSGLESVAVFLPFTRGAPVLQDRPPEYESAVKFAVCGRAVEGAVIADERLTTDTRESDEPPTYEAVLELVHQTNAM